jgi:hypothetical protein
LEDLSGAGNWRGIPHNVLIVCISDSEAKSREQSPRRSMRTAQDLLVHRASRAEDEQVVVPQRIVFGVYLWKRCTPSPAWARS